MRILIPLQVGKQYKLIDKVSLPFFLILTLTLVPWPVFSDSIKDARKTTNAFFKDQSFIAKIDLQTTGNYHVTPDGLPLEDKTLGRKKKLGIGQRDIAVAAGSKGKAIYVSPKARKKVIIVALAPKRGITMHQARVFIHFDRRLEVADVSPEAIARALVSYIEISGVKVGGELDDAINQLGDATPAPASSTPAQSMLLSNLSVEAQPSTLKRGEKVNLLLHFTVLDQQNTVTEQRDLMLNGQQLPSFPKNHSQLRGIGSHISQFQQPIPANAPSGTYEFKGEICAGDVCMSRKAKFVVE